MSLTCEESLSDVEEMGSHSGMKPTANGCNDEDPFLPRKRPADSDFNSAHPSKRRLIDFETGEPIILADDEKKDNGDDRTNVGGDDNKSYDEGLNGNTDDDVEILLTKPGSKLQITENCRNVPVSTLYGQKIPFPKTVAAPGEMERQLPSRISLQESKRFFSGKPRIHTVTTIGDIVGASSSSTSASDGASKKQFIEIGNVLLNRSTERGTNGAGADGCAYPSIEPSGPIIVCGDHGHDGVDETFRNISNSRLVAAPKTSSVTPTTPTQIVTVFPRRDEGRSKDGRPVYRFQAGKVSDKDIERRKRDIASYRKTKEQLAKISALGRTLGRTLGQTPSVVETTEKHIKEQQLKKKLQSMIQLRPKHKIIQTCFDNATSEEGYSSVANHESATSEITNSEVAPLEINLVENEGSERTSISNGTGALSKPLMEIPSPNDHYMEPPSSMETLEIDLNSDFEWRTFPSDFYRPSSHGHGTFACGKCSSLNQSRTDAEYVDPAKLWSHQFYVHNASARVGHNDIRHNFTERVAHWVENRSKGIDQNNSPTVQEFLERIVRDKQAVSSQKHSFTTIVHPHPAPTPAPVVLTGDTDPRCFQSKNKEANKESVKATPAKSATEIHERQKQQFELNQGKEHRKPDQMRFDIALKKLFLQKQNQNRLTAFRRKQQELQQLLQQQYRGSSGTQKYQPKRRTSLTHKRHHKQPETKRLKPAKECKQPEELKSLQTLVNKVPQKRPLKTKIDYRRCVETMAYNHENHLNATIITVIKLHGLYKCIFCLDQSFRNLYAFSNHQRTEHCSHCGKYFGPNPKTVEAQNARANAIANHSLTHHVSEEKTFLSFLDSKQIMRRRAVFSVYAEKYSALAVDIQSGCGTGIGRKQILAYAPVADDEKAKGESDESREQVVKSDEKKDESGRKRSTGSFFDLTVDPPIRMTRGLGENFWIEELRIDPLIAMKEEETCFNRLRLHYCLVCQIEARKSNPNGDDDEESSTLLLGKMDLPQLRKHFLQAHPEKTWLFSEEFSQCRIKAHNEYSRKSNDKPLKTTKISPDDMILHVKIETRKLEEKEEKVGIVGEGEKVARNLLAEKKKCEVEGASKVMNFCGVCQFSSNRKGPTFESSLGLSRHVSEVHSNLLFCPFCFCCVDDSTFMERHLLETHAHMGKDADLRQKLVSHSPRTFSAVVSCKICSFVFLSASLLYEHILTTHEVDGTITELEGLFPCAFCLESFGSARHLKDHFLLRHLSTVARTSMAPARSDRDLATVIEDDLQPSIVPPEPSIDPALFQTWRHRYHDYRVSTANPKCPICGEMFRTVSAAQLHYHSRHGEARIKCTLCPRLELNGEFLMLHMRFHHWQEFPLRCHLCPEMFKKIAEFEDHFDAHLDEKSDGLVNEDKSATTSHADLSRLGEDGEGGGQDRVDDLERDFQPEQRAEEEEYIDVGEEWRPTLEEGEKLYLEHEQYEEEINEDEECEEEMTNETMEETLEWVLACPLCKILHVCREDLLAHIKDAHKDVMKARVALPRIDEIESEIVQARFKRDLKALESKNVETNQRATHSAKDISTDTTMTCPLCNTFSSSDKADHLKHFSTDHTEVFEQENESIMCPLCNRFSSSKKSDHLKHYRDHIESFEREKRISETPSFNGKTGYDFVEKDSSVEKLPKIVGIGTLCKGGTNGIEEGTPSNSSASVANYADTTDVIAADSASAVDNAEAAGFGFATANTNFTDVVVKTEPRFMTGSESHFVINEPETATENRFHSVIMKVEEVDVKETEENQPSHHDIDDDAFFKAMMENLRHLVALAMPNAISRYNYEAKLFADKRQKWIEEAKAKEGGISPRIPNQNHKLFGVLQKKFFWSKKVRELFTAVVERYLRSIAALDAAGEAGLSRQAIQPRRLDALRRFLEERIKPLWPAGWMTVRALVKASRPTFTRVWDQTVGKTHLKRTSHT